MARILVIDDSQVIRDLLTDLLTDMGHNVVTAADGESGLALARTDTWDLCVCDCHLPRLNGYQILSEMSKFGSTMPFVFTDSLPDELHQQIAAATDFPCLRKPFDLNQLRDVLQRVLTPVKTS
jgi:CheY-like chemotaxis protein